MSLALASLEGPRTSEIGRGLVRRPTAQRDRSWPCYKAHGLARSAVPLLEGPLPREICRGLVRRLPFQRD